MINKINNKINTKLSNNNISIYSNNTTFTSKIDKDTEKLLENLSNMQNISNVLTYANDELSKTKNYTKLSSGLFRYKNYIIALENSTVAQATINNLLLLENLNLSCVPKLIQIKKLEDDYTALVLQISNKSDTTFSIYSQDKKDVPIDKKKIFLSDFDKMAEHNVYNPAILNNTDDWLIKSEDKSLFIFDWSKLSYFISDEDKNEARKWIVNNCGLIYS